MKSTCCFGCMQAVLPWWRMDFDVTMIRSLQRRTRDYSDPFVDGTPATRGSSASASRSARANDLNAASMM